MLAALEPALGWTDKEVITTIATVVGGPSCRSVWPLLASPAAPSRLN